MSTSTPATNRQSICTFRVDDFLFGVEVCQVQEVIRNHQTTRVPLADGVVHGLMNLRGQIVTALSMRHKLGLPDSDPDRKPMNVVVRSNDGPISLLVDEIGDVVQVDDGCYEPLPETLQGSQRDLMRGAYKLDGRLLLILDTERVLEAAA